MLRVKLLKFNNRTTKRFMESKINAFMDYVKERNAYEPEFLQAVTRSSRNSNSVH